MNLPYPSIVLVVQPFAHLLGCNLTTSSGCLGSDRLKFFAQACGAQAGASGPKLRVIIMFLRFSSIPFGPVLFGFCLKPK